MKQIDRNDPVAQSADVVAQNIETLKILFPDAVAEGKIDLAVIKELIGESLLPEEERDEKYGLNWFGKRKARQIALTPSTGTLRPCPEDSVDWDTTKNLLIEGDNLEVLKLLQKPYAGKVKLIYIDPPYNTGKDFVYPDNFQDNIKNYLELTGQIEGGAKMQANTESSGRYHTDWLNMMYPRLKLAKNLLCEDGLIFINIDDSELSRLTTVCDEIFGEENYLNTVSVNMKNIAGASGGGEDKRLKKNLEYILIYTKTYDTFTNFNGVYEYYEISELLKEYVKNDVSWKYTTVLYRDGEKVYFDSTVDGDGNEIKIYERKNYSIMTIKKVCEEEGISESEAYFKYAHRIFQTAMPQSSIRTRVMDKVLSLGSKSDLYSIEYTPKSGKNKGILYEQFYKGDSFRLFAWLGDVSEKKDGKLYKKERQGTFWDFVGETKNLTKEGDVPFPNGKKPLALIERILGMIDDKQAIVLDFFAGSATTGHAIYRQNSMDSGYRRYILIQLPEVIDKEDKNQVVLTEFCEAEGKPNNIAEVSKERLRRAGKKIKEENPMFTGDTGFRVFKLDTSNIRPWEPDWDNLDEMIKHSINHIKDGRSEEDILYELLLKLGLDLSIPIEEKKIGNKKVQAIGAGTLMVCLDKSISRSDAEPLALGIIAWHKELAPIGETTCVFLDSAFADDVAKSNLSAILQQHGLENVRSL